MVFWPQTWRYGPLFQPPQCLVEDTDQRSQQKHVIYKKQRRNSEVPEHNTLLTKAVSLDPLHVYHKQEKIMFCVPTTFFIFELWYQKEVWSVFLMLVLCGSKEFCYCDNLIWGLTSHHGGTQLTPLADNPARLQSTCVTQVHDQSPSLRSAHWLSSD